MSSGILQSGLQGSLTAKITTVNLFHLSLAKATYQRPVVSLLVTATNESNDQLTRLFLAQSETTGSIDSSRQDGHSILLSLVDCHNSGVEYRYCRNRPLIVSVYVFMCGYLAKSMWKN